MESASAHMDSACYHKCIARTVAYLVSIVDELAATWDARTQPRNHLSAPWSMDLHGSVDVKAFYVVRPRFSQQHLYNGKYGSHVLKYQFIVDNRATPIDVHADNAYVGIGLDKLVCPFKHGSLYDSINGKKHRAWTASEALSGVVSVRVKRPTLVAAVGRPGSGMALEQTFFVSRVVACYDELHAPCETSGAVTELSAGEHAFPFSVGLPRNLPTSYRSPSGDEFLAYYASAAVRISSGRTVESPECECPFTVVASGAMPVHEESHTRISSGDGLFVALELAKHAALGDIVWGLITVTNHTSHTASRTVLTLFGRHAQPKSEASVVYSSTTLPALPPGQSMNHMVSMRMPQDAMPDTNMGRLSWQHAVHVEVATGLLRHNLHLYAPVVILAPMQSPAHVLRAFAQALRTPRDFGVPSVFMGAHTRYPPQYRRPLALPAGCEEVTALNGSMLVLDHVARTVIGPPGAEGSAYPNWQSAVLPPGWTVGSDQGETFFVNHVEGYTSWVDPRPPHLRVTPASQLARSVLEITALRGAGLLKPNAQCSVLQWRQNFNKPEKLKTEEGQKTLNPVWEENNVMRLEYNLRTRTNVVVYIKSKSNHIAGDYLGCVDIDLTYLPANVVVQQWFPVSNGKNPKMAVSGDILLRLYLHDLVSVSSHPTLVVVNCASSFIVPWHPSTAKTLFGRRTLGEQSNSNSNERVQQRAYAPAPPSVPAEAPPPYESGAPRLGDGPEWPSTRLADLVPGSASSARGHAVPLPDVTVRLYDAGTTAPAGDVDGDGVVDVVAAGCGAVHVVLGPVGASAALPRAVADKRAIRVEAPRCPCSAKVTVESAGDINCDGVGDVAVVCGASDGSSAAYVLLGRRRPAPWPSSLDDRGPRALVVALAGPVARVAAVGDVNGDNCTDVAVALRPSARSVRVVYGRPTAQWPPVLDVERLGPSEGFAVPGVATFAGVGDVDGDAVDDVVLGDPERNVSDRMSAGASFLVFGRRTSAFPSVLDTGTAEGVVAIVGERAGDGLGHAVGAAGDVDGDGHADFVVCLQSRGDETSASSRYLLVFGVARPSWPRTAVAGAADGLQRCSLVSHRDSIPPLVSVGSAGDINGDGFGDVALCPQEWSSGTECAVVFGSNSSWPRRVNADSLKITYISVPSFFRSLKWNAGPLGDIDGDGIDDLLLSAPEAAGLTGNINLGSSFVVRGRNASSHFPGRLRLAEGSTKKGYWYALTGGSDAPLAGASVSGVGDMDNDTIGDFAVGAPGAGRVYLVLDSAASGNAYSGYKDTARVTIESGEEGDLLGWSVSSAGDVNGDRVPDLIAGAPGAAGGAGRAYVVFGRSGGWGAGAVLRVGALDGTSGFAIAGDAGAGGLGFAVSAAGDVNGDGIDDVLVGAVQTQLPLIASDVVASVRSRRSQWIAGGRGYVLLGRRQWPRTVSVTALQGTDGFAVDGGPSGSLASSMELSGVGDINGDRMADFALGTVYLGLSHINWTVHVVFGRATWGPSLSVLSLDGTNGFTVTDTASPGSTVSLAGVGDANGDGVGDLAIGLSKNGVHVILGHRGAWPAVTGSVQKIEGAELASAGMVTSADVNGDNLTDIVCLRSTAFNNQEGVVVTFGRRHWPPVTVPVKGDMVVSGDGVLRLRSSVSSAGDCNGDGVEDLVIGTVDYRDGAGRAWVVYGSRAPRVARAIGETPGCCRAQVGARYAFTVPADTCVQDSDPTPLVLNATWSDVTDGYRTYSSDWLSFDNATGSFSGGPTHAGSVQVEVSCINARGVRARQTFSLYVASSIEVSIGDNSGKVTFGGKKSSETQLAPIVVNSTGSRVQVSIAANAESLRSREHSDDVVVSQAGATWTANGTVAGVNRLLSRLVFGPFFTQDSIEFTLLAEDDLGGSYRAQWSATRDARDRDDPSSVWHNFLVIGLPIIAGVCILTLFFRPLVALIRGRMRMSSQRDQQLGDVPEWSGIRLADLMPGSASSARGHAVPLPDAPVRLYNAGTTAPTGDVDGDGAADVVAAGCGAVHVVLGPVGASVALPRAVAETHAFRVDAPSCQCGSKQSGSSTKCAVVFGSNASWPRHLNATEDTDVLKILLISAPSYSRALGGYAGPLGDIDGDGVDDLLLSAPEATGRTGNIRMGSSFVVPGRNASSLAPGHLTLSEEIERQGYGYVLAGGSDAPMAGASVSGVGDMDNDTVGDFAVGAPGAGRVYLVLGSAASSNVYSGGKDTARVTIESGEAGDLLGWSVSSAGDVNGDRVPDLIAGAPGAAGGAGRAYVVFGRSGGWGAGAVLRVGALDGTSGFAIAGDAGAGGLGFAVSAAGDVNRDGIDDVLVGAVQTRLPLGADGFAVVDVLSGRSEASSMTLSGVGDINGDGYADFALGSAYTRALRNWTTFSFYIASSIEVSIGDNSGKVTFGGEKSGETQLAPIVVNSTGSRVQVSIIADAKSMRSREHSDDVAVSCSGVTWRANGTVAGVNRVLSRLVFGHYFTQDSVDFTLRAEDDLGGFCRAEWGATRDAKDRDDPTSVYHYYYFLVIGLPIIAGVAILMLFGGPLMAASRARGHAVPLPDAPVRLYDAGTTAPAGDVDGDGVVDVVAAGCGAVHVVLGPVGASVALPRAVAEGRALRVDAPRCPCDAKVTVESAGDINCDGVGDVAVVCGASDGSSAAYVLLGRRRPAPWPSSLDDRGPRALVVALAGPVARVAAVGDVNGDNCTDVAVALRPSARSVRVVYGRPTAQWPPVLDVERLGPSEGFAVPGVATFAGVGDVDGDAVDDVVFGDPERKVSDKTSTGAAFLVFGRPASAFPSVLDTSTAEGVVAIVGERAGDGVGQAVGAAGDVDGDGHADFVVCMSPSGDPALSRYLLVFGGPNASWPRTAVAGAAVGLPRWSLVAAHRTLSPFWGPSVPPVVSAGPAGDINGDGFGDVALCAQQSGSHTECAVVFGSNSSWPRHVTATEDTNVLKILLLSAPSYSRALGGYAGPLGDIDGDGVDDLLLSAHEDTGRTENIRMGSSFVVRGRNASSLAPGKLKLSEGVAQQGYWYVLRGGSDAPLAGASVSGVGDMDNDTVGDFAVGAPGAGRVYLDLGATGVNSEGAARVTIESEEEGDLLGWSVSSAGDVNGDRVPDLIAGAPGASGGAGRAYVVFGRSGGWGAGAVLRVGALDGTSGFAIAGDAGAGGLGFAVSAAGDVNGDGIDDVLVGAVQTRLPLFASDVVQSVARPMRFVGCRGYVLLGRSQWPRSVSVSALSGADGFAVVDVLSVPSEASSITLSGVGDINGDGFDDFALGSAYLRAMRNWTVRVVFGRAAWGPSLSVRSLDGTNGFTVADRERLRTASVYVAGVGDINDDGVGDFVVGTADSGVYVLFGRKGKDTWPAVVSPLQEDEGNKRTKLDLSGVRQVTSADLNGDGLSDVVCLSTPSYNNPARVVVMFGRRRWPPVVFPSVTDRVVSGDGVIRLQGSVSSAGDRDGDGVDDLVIGAVEHRNGTGRAWVVYGSRAPRVVRPIQDCPGCCRARVGARYAFTVPADTCAQDSDPAPLALNASWSEIEDYRTYSSEWLSFDKATGSFSGVPTHTGSLRVVVRCTNARGARIGQTFGFYIASSIEVSIGDNSGKVTFGGEKSGETQLAPIVVNSTGSRVQVSIIADAKSMRSREHSDDVTVSRSGVTWRANGTVSGVNRVLSRLVFGHYFTQDSVDFTLRAEDDLGGFSRAEWGATRDAKDRDDPTSVYHYYYFLVIGLPIIAGVAILMLFGGPLLTYIVRRMRASSQRDHVPEEDGNMTEN
eukprot:m51a1_g7923 hypothetical protein (3755) ;mRNA; r:9186-34133